MAVSSTTEGVIPGFLGRVREVLYRHEAARAVLYAFAAVAAVALIVPLLGHVVGGSRARAFAVLGIAGLAAALVIIGAIVIGWLAPRRRWSSDAELARWVGTRKKDVASDLLSSVELVAAPARPGSPSPELVDALVAATSARLEGVEPRALLPQGEVRRAVRWLLAAIAANVVLIAIAPSVYAGGWRSLIRSPEQPFDGAQLSAVPLVGDLEATLTSPAYSHRPVLPLPSSSGDVRGLPGTKVELKARVLVPAVAVDVVIDSVTKAGETQRIPAQVDGDSLKVSLVIDKSTHYRFEVAAPSGARMIETSPRAIDAEPDQAPTVQLMAPADTLDVSNLRRVELAFVIEDDFGLTTAELVWDSGKDKGKKPLTLDSSGARAQGKVLWDISEIQVPSGGEVRYWVEAKDNDTVGGPNVGKSKELRLRVISPRERHEETLGRQQELAEKIVKNLGARLTLVPDDAATGRDELGRTLKEAVVELGSIGAAFEKDPHASDAMRKALSSMRERLDKLETLEAKLMPQKGRGRFGLLDPKLIGELEDDTITLADWLDRERLEGLLDLSDEIAAHEKRLAELMAQYAKSKDPRLLEEIEREMKALDRLYAEMEKHKKGMPEDVLDQYVHQDAMQAQQGEACMDEVKKLVRAGQVAQAQQKLEQCRQQHASAASALEGSLANLRGDKFSEEQKKLDEVMNELSDVAKDQDDIAAESNRIFESYAEKADEMAKEGRREASKKVGALVDKLRKRIAEINESGLTPFAKEELDIVERRLADVEKMVADGDLAEALGMARQAKTSLDTIAGELEAALNDDPKSKWADATQDALDGVTRANPVVKELISELQSLSPKPDQILSPDDMRALDRLRRREAMNKQRTQRLSDRTKQLGSDLPGDTGQELGKKLGGAIEQMGSADDRMKQRDPSGAREATRAAADALSKARDRARSAARQAQQGSVSDEPIRIPGADEYKAPERFRQDILEGAKKNPGAPPTPFDDMLDRYYKELTK